MKGSTELNLRTAAGIAAWVGMVALSQESAALTDPQREDFARYSDWGVRLMATAPCGESLSPTLSGSERALICAEATHLSSDRSEADGKARSTDTYLLRDATYTVISGTIVAAFR